MVMGSGRTGFGGDADGGLGSGTEKGGGQYGQDGDGLHWLDDTAAHIILGMETNAPLSYALGL